MRWRLSCPSQATSPLICCGVVLCVVPALLSLSRCCILENYQTADGVKVPEVLQPFEDSWRRPFLVLVGAHVVFGVGAVVLMRRVRKMV